MTVVTVEFIQELFKDEYPDVVIRDIKFGAGATPGDNSSSVVLRIYMTGTQRSEQEPWKYTIIYKQLHNPPKNAIFNCLCENEAAFYNKVWPVLEKLQFLWKIHDLYQSVPKCYLARTDCILLHDLKSEGFLMADKSLGLTLQQSHLALRHLAQFHALSLCMKYQNPEGFREMLEDKDSIKEVLFVDGKLEVLEKLFEKTTESAISCVEQELSGSKDRDIYLDKFREFCVVERLYNTMVRLVTKKEPLSVICHGDCWTNNLMFQYVDNEVVDLRMVDYQLVRYTSLAIDLIYILYLSIERELRIQHFDALLLHYSEELRRRVGEMMGSEDSLSLETILNIDNFDKLLRDEIRRCLPYGLGIALNLFPIMTMSQEEALNAHTKESDSAALENESSTSTDLILPLTANPEFGRKMTRLLIDLVEDGVL